MATPAERMVVKMMLLRIKNDLGYLKEKYSNKFVGVECPLIDSAGNHSYEDAQLFNLLQSSWDCPFCGFHVG